MHKDPKAQAAIQEARDACRNAINEATRVAFELYGKEYHRRAGEPFERELKLQMIEAICEVL